MRHWLVLSMLAAATGVACRRAPRPATTTLVLHVTADGAPAAARVQLVDQHGKPVHAGAIDLFGARQGAAACPLAPGVTATWDGIVLAAGEGEVPIGPSGRDHCTPSPIPYGRYHVVAWQGIEHERWEGDVDLSAQRGRVELAIVLERAWSPDGMVAADLHVHALGSNDSNMPLPQRVAAQAAAGIQVSALTNHNVVGTLDGAIRELHLEHRIVALPAIELTAEQVHANVYPVPLGSAPDAQALVHANPTQLLAAARAFPGHPIVQINHPRFRVTALFDSTGWNGVAWPPPFPRDFDAFEVINGFTALNAPADRRIDDSIRDLYTFTAHGFLVAALGASDTHDYNWVHDGLARTYVRLPDSNLDHFDPQQFVAAIRARHTLATTGPWLAVEVSAQAGGPVAGPGDLVATASGHVVVHVTVSRARFVHADHLRVTVGGQTQVIPLADQRTSEWTGTLDVGTTDTWVGVAVDSDTPMPLDQTGTYQVDKWKRAGNTPAAVISPILVDANGDGVWTAPQG